MQLLMSVLQSRNHVVDRAHHRRLPVGCWHTPAIQYNTIVDALYVTSESEAWDDDD